MTVLNIFGWDQSLDQFLKDNCPGQLAARVLEVQRNGFLVHAESGEFFAELSGRTRKELLNQDLQVCVGDWVHGTLSADLFWVQGILPRRTFLQRADPGGGTQSLVANADELWILSSSNQDYSPERVERYAAMASAGGVKPVVIVTKADISQETPEQVKELTLRLAGVEVFGVSATTGLGIAELEARLVPARTIALMGSSGVGKSTLVNCLMKKEVQHTLAVRAGDDKGVHTTTVRRLFLSPQQACIIDTPGMRELALVGEKLDGFDDIEALALGCRFHNCSHGQEPGCAVRGARESGALSAERWENYAKLQRELAFLERKTNKASASDEKKKWKTITKSQKEKKR